MQTQANARRRRHTHRRVRRDVRAPRLPGIHRDTRTRIQRTMIDLDADSTMVLRSRDERLDTR